MRTEEYLQNLENKIYEQKPLSMTSLFANFKPLNKKIEPDKQLFYDKLRFYKKFFNLQVHKKSITKAGKLFKNLTFKLQFYTDWEKLFGDEQINQVENLIKKVESFNNDVRFKLHTDFFGDLNTGNDYIVNNSEQYLSLSCIISQKNTSEKSFYDFIDKVIMFPEYYMKQKVDDNPSKLTQRMKTMNNFLKSMEELSLIGINNLYNLENKTKKDYFRNLYKNPNLDEGINNVLLRHEGYYLHDSEIKQYISKFSKITEIFSICYYLLFLKNSLKTKKLDLKSLEVVGGILSIRGYDDYKSFQKNAKSDIYTYKWTISKYGDLKNIFKRLKHKLVNCGTKDFEAIFNNKKTSEIKPIQTKFLATELLYFITQLMEFDFITKEKNLSLERLKSCFVKSDGTLFTEGFSTLKNQLKSDVDNNIFTTLSQQKRKEIDIIISGK